MAKVNSKKKMDQKQKKLILIILSAVVAVSILCSLLFGLKLYAFGKDVKVVYNATGGKVENQYQIVEVCKSYTLETPKKSGYEFKYWSTDGTEKGKVSQKGIWIETTKPQITLVAVWVRTDDEWTGNY